MVQQRRFRWFGHCIRAPRNSPTAQALKLALDVSDVNRPHRCPPLRWIDIVKKDLATIGLSLTEAEAKVAKDRDIWHKIAAGIYSV